MTAAMSGKGAVGDESEVRKALADFMKGFEPLNAAHLVSFMAPEVTAFLPFVPRRIDGREAVKAAFEEFFSVLRRDLPDPPHLRLVVEHMEIQMAGSVAMVSLELPHPGFLGRRSLMFEKHNGSWRIFHVHASEIEVK
jgi:ketosteroid isomerase-like protein